MNWVRALYGLLLAVIFAVLWIYECYWGALLSCLVFWVDEPLVSVRVNQKEQA